MAIGGVLSVRRIGARCVAALRDRAVPALAAARRTRRLRVPTRLLLLDAAGRSRHRNRRVPRRRPRVRRDHRVRRRSSSRVAPDGRSRRRSPCSASCSWHPAAAAETDAVDDGPRRRARAGRCTELRALHVRVERAIGVGHSSRSVMGALFGLGAVLLVPVLLHHGSAPASGTRGDRHNGLPRPRADVRRVPAVRGGTAVGALEHGDRHHAHRAGRRDRARRADRRRDASPPSGGRASRSCSAGIVGLVSARWPHAARRAPAPAPHLRRPACGPAIGWTRVD